MPKPMTDKAMTAVERELATDIRMSLEAFRDGEATFDETHADLLTLSRQSVGVEEILNAKLALANWSKYNGETANEFVYQAEKVASSLRAILSRLTGERA